LIQGPYRPEEVSGKDSWGGRDDNQNREASKHKDSQLGGGQKKGEVREWGKISKSKVHRTGGIGRETLRVYERGGIGKKGLLDR